MAKDDPERATRLAEALRQNLRRRKTQAREMDGGPATPANVETEKSPAS